MTNIEWIANMNIDDFAKLLDDFRSFYNCVDICGCEPLHISDLPCELDCIEQIKKWLLSEYKDEV